MEWKISSEFVPYEEALAFMEARVAAIRAGKADECVWLLEHPPLYTAGTSAKDDDLVEAHFPVFETGRGGQYTYHGPGQRVAYIMLDLKKRSDAPDIRKFVKQLEQLIIQTLARFDVSGFTADGRIGVWVREEFRVQSSKFSDHFSKEQERGQQAEPLVGGAVRPIAQGGRPKQGHTKESKIAALGIRVRHWVTFHGISINVNPDLAHFDGIVPCGISPKEFGVTSLNALGKDVAMEQLDEALKAEFETIFG